MINKSFAYEYYYFMFGESSGYVETVDDDVLGRGKKYK